MPEELTTKSATELARLIRSRSVSPVEIVKAFLQRIEQINSILNAIITVADDVLDRAQTAEAAVMSGKNPGLLHGVPVTVKDTIDTTGILTTSGSRIRSNHVPLHDATVVGRLKAVGAIVLGKTNTPEMAIPYETENPIFGRTNNPYDLKKTCGGSSGGEAAAIAACLSPAGIGSDLSGSIRVPAHFCGIVGLKPTTGRVPMDGHTPAAIGPLALGACIGPMARCVSDVKLLFDVLAGEESLVTEKRELRGIRVGMYVENPDTPVTAEIRAAVEAAAMALGEAHLDVAEATPPAVSEGSRLWIELFSSTAANQLRDFYEGNEDHAGPIVTSILETTEERALDMAGKIDQAEALARSLVERERLRQELLRWMKTMPLILTPVGAVPAFAHGAKRIVVGRDSFSVFRAFGYSQAFNVFGLPSVCVPAGQSAEGLPIGVQIVAQPNEENTILSAAAVIEEKLGGWRPPPQF